MRHVSVTLSLIAAFAGGLLLANLSGCILDDGFVTEPGTFQCESDDDCISGYVCDPATTTCVFEGEEMCEDKDGDGYGVGDDLTICPNPEEDPDDTNDAIFPGAIELCDGVNNDGDDETDEPIACMDISDCIDVQSEIPSNLSGVLFSCSNNLCVLVPQMRAMPPCDTLTISCVDGTYDIGDAEQCGVSRDTSMTNNAMN